MKTRTIVQDELAKERGKVRELAGEGARRALQERGAAEQRYHAHCDELQRDLDTQYDNVAKLQVPTALHYFTELVQLDDKNAATKNTTVLGRRQEQQERDWKLIAGNERKED